VIGSVHFLDDWNFDGDESFYGKWSNDELYQRYFSLIIEAARSKLFDTLGHLDLIKKYGVYPETDQTPLFERTADVIRDSGLVVELNTSGLDKPCREFYPGQHWLDTLFNRGIPVTLSSDAHHPEQIARHYQQAVSILKKTGYRQIITFRNRNKIPSSI
jgi:histidinol-phosphatase (PHP family)